jgi:hypothetical protein
MKIIKKVRSEEVVTFFCKINKNPGNKGLVETIKKIPFWYFIELEKDEFDCLECQTEPHLLLKDLDYQRFFKDRNDIKDKLHKLRTGKKLPPIIIREKFGCDMTDASYYLEDGTGKSVAIKIYELEGGTSKIRAYLGISLALISTIKY